MYVCVYVRMYVSVRVCVYIYMYLHMLKFLKRKCNLLFIWNQPVPLCKHSITDIKPKHLMTFKAKSLSVLG